MINLKLKQWITFGMVTVCSVSMLNNTMVSAASNSKPVDFADMKYEHLETKKFYSTIKEIESLMDSKASFKKIAKKWNYLNKFSDQLASEVTQSMLYNSLNVTDPYYVKESQYSNATYYELSDAFLKITQKLLTSSYQEEMEKLVNDPEEVKEILEDKPLTKRQHELLDEEKKLVLKYNELSTATYSTLVNGKTYTEDQLATATDLSEADLLAANRRIVLKQNRTLGNLYVKLVKIRKELAQSLGYDSYAEYCYKENYERDYTVEDAAVFDQGVKQDIAPYYAELLDKVQNDVDYDALSKKYGSLSAEEKCNRMSPYLSEISPSLTEAYDYMTNYHLFDIDYRDNKQNGGFTILLPKYNEPFINIQPNLAFTDLGVFIHEFGHYHNAYLHKDEHGKYNNLDLAEIHSQGLELLYTKYYDKLFEKEDVKAINEFTVFNIVDSVVAGALYDEFQQKVFEMDDPTLDKINTLFTDLSKEYHMVPEETKLNLSWTYVGHNFDVPFYYISYATSAAPALQLWNQSLSDYDGACKTYMNIVKKGEAGKYKQVLKECHLADPFTQGYFKDLSNTMSTYFSK